MNTFNQKGRDLFIKWEGIEKLNKADGLYYPYLCPAGVATIGIGHVIYEDGKEVRDLYRANELQKPLTLQGVYDLFDDDIADYSHQTQVVCDKLELKFDDNKFSALVSFCYNCGVGSLKNVLTKYKDGMNIETLINQYRFATINGEKKELRGLMLRRKSEVYLFQNGVNSFT